MIVIKKIFLLILFLLLLISCKDNYKINNFKNGDKIKISGMLVLIGNEPLAKIGINTGNDFFYLKNELLMKYRHLLGTKITATGKLEIKTYYTADLKIAITEKHITQIYSLKSYK